MMKILHNITKYITAFISLIMIFYYIWFRFIRERLPKEIPFELSILGFIILCLICTTYMYIIYRYFRPKIPHPIILEIIYKISRLFEPFYMLNELIRFTRYYKLIYINKILFKIIKKVNNLTTEDPIYININKVYNFYIYFRLFPKMFMLIIFFIDIFYFQKLDYFYISILLAAYLLLWRYLIFSAEKTLEDILLFLERNYIVYVIQEDWKDYFFDLLSMKPIDRFPNDDAKFGDEDPCSEDFDEDFEDPYSYYDRDENYKPMHVHTNVRYFLNAQIAAIECDYSLYSYTCIERPRARYRYCEIYNLQLPRICVQEPAYDEVSKELAKYFHKLMSFAIDLSLFLERDISLLKYKYKYIKRMDMIIILGYLICWSYILIVQEESIPPSQPPWR